MSVKIERQSHGYTMVSGLEACATIRDADVIVAGSVLLPPILDGRHGLDGVEIGKLRTDAGRGETSVLLDWGTTDDEDEILGEALYLAAVDAIYEDGPDTVAADNQRKAWAEERAQ